MSQGPVGRSGVGGEGRLYGGYKPLTARTVRRNNKSKERRRKRYSKGNRKARVTMVNSHKMLKGQFTTKSKIHIFPRTCHVINQSKLFCWELTSF